MTAEVLRARDWTVETVPAHEGKRLILNHHYAKTWANTAVAVHGLRRVGLFASVEGVAWWIPPTRATAEAIAGEDWLGVLSLSRLVVAPDVPKNAASFLLGRSMKLLDRHRWPVLLTYADTRHGHTGAIYKATNWRCDGEVAAGPSWVGPDGEQRGSKRGPVTYRVAEMEARGFVKLDPMPKIRFVHDARR